MTDTPKVSSSEQGTSVDFRLDGAVSIWLIRPGEYRFVLVTEEEGRGLERDYPDGKLQAIGDRFLWVIPAWSYGSGVPPS